MPRTVKTYDDVNKINQQRAAAGSSNITVATRPRTDSIETLGSINSLGSVGSAKRSIFDETDKEFEARKRRKEILADKRKPENEREIIDLNDDGTAIKRGGFNHKKTTHYGVRKKFAESRPRGEGGRFLPKKAPPSSDPA